MNLIHLVVLILLYLFTPISATVSPEIDTAQLVTLNKDQFVGILKQITFDYLKSELNITDDKILNDLFQKEFPLYFADYSSHISFANDESLQKFKEHFRTNIESGLSSEVLINFKDLLRNNADELSKVKDAYNIMRADYSTLQRLQKEYNTYLLRWKDAKIAKNHFLSELKAFMQSLTEKSVNVLYEQQYRNFEECSKKLISFLEPSEDKPEYEVNEFKTSFRYAIDIFSFNLYEPFIDAFDNLIEEITRLNQSFPSVVISKMRNGMTDYMNKFLLLDELISKSIQFRIPDKSICWSLEELDDRLKLMITAKEKVINEKYNDEKYNFHGKPIHILLERYETVEAYMRGMFTFLMNNTICKTQLTDYTIHVAHKDAKIGSAIQKPAEKPDESHNTFCIVVIIIGIVIIIVVIVKVKKGKYNVKERF